MGDWVVDNPLITYCNGLALCGLLGNLTANENMGCYKFRG